LLSICLCLLSGVQGVVGNKGVTGDKGMQGGKGVSGNKGVVGDHLIKITCNSLSSDGI
jgi:hypothetical protein